MYNYHRQIPPAIPPSEMPGYIKGSDKFYYHLPRVINHPNYCIDRNGKVYHIPDGTEVAPQNEKIIIIENEVLDIDKALLAGYVGICGLPAVPRDIFPRNEQYIGRRCSALTYGYHKMDLSNINHNVMMLDNEEFRLIPFAQVPIAISRNGVVFNLGYNDFVMRSYASNAPVISMTIFEDQFHAMFPKESGNTHIWGIDRLVNIAWYNRLDAPNAFTTESADNVIANADAPIMDKIAALVAKGYQTEAIANILAIPYIAKEDRKRLSNTINKLRNDPARYADLRKRYGIPLRGGADAGKLSDRDVNDIRLALSRGISGIDLAQAYGVTPSMISKIKSGKRR